MRQNAIVITNFDDFITKCDSYYKMRRLLQIATVQKLYQKVFYLSVKEHATNVINFEKTANKDSLLTKKS